MDAICSTTVPVGTRLHWSTDSRLYGSVETGREAQCGWRTKICDCPCDLEILPIFPKNELCYQELVTNIFAYSKV